MASSITWLHFSDLHACNPRTGWDSGDVLADFEKDLVRLRESHQLVPDLIFFTGDAGFGHLGAGEGESLAAQLDEAEGFFRRLCEICGVAQDRFFLVPGNHDVHRGKVNDSDTESLDARIGQGDGNVVALLKSGGPRWQSIVRRLDEYRAFLERKGYEHLLADRQRLLFTSVCEVGGLKLGVAGFNTAWSCCRDGERGKLWWGGRWQTKDGEPGKGGPRPSPDQRRSLLRNEREGEGLQLRPTRSSGRDRRYLSAALRRDWRGLGRVPAGRQDRE